jgi:hypothetical protein
MPEYVYIIDGGDTVCCDLCNENYPSGDPRSGGFLMGSYGVGPCCADRMRKRLLEAGKSAEIKDTCPESMSFRQWILAMR